MDLLKRLFLEVFRLIVSNGRMGLMFKVQLTSQQVITVSQQQMLMVANPLTVCSLANPLSLQQLLIFLIFYALGTTVELLI